MFEGLSRWLWNIVFWVVRLRLFFLPILLTVATILLFQFWQELTREPIFSPSMISNNVFRVTMYSPDRLVIGARSESTVGFQFEALGNLPTNGITITIDLHSDQGAVFFQPAQLSVRLIRDSQEENKSVKMEYRKIDSADQEVKLRADILADAGSRLSLQSVTRVDTASQPTIVIVSAIFTAFAGVITLLTQIKNLIKKN